jgi:MerR HTH family regulatory protein
MVIGDQDDATDSMPWSVDGVIEVAERIMAAAPEMIPQTDPKNKKELNVRLIRDYVVRGFISRPARSGREVRFGLDHLVHLLTVRALLRNQKWSLPAIKDSFAATSSAELLDIVLAPVRSRIHAEYQKAVKAAGFERRTPSRLGQPSCLNPAQLLIQRFKSGDGSSKREHGSAAQSVSLVACARLVQANSETASSGLLPSC